MSLRESNPCRSDPIRLKCRPHTGRDHACVADCIMAQALDGLCVGLVLTGAAGEVLWLNRAAEQVLAVTEAECAGRPFKQVIRDPQLARVWQQAMADGGMVFADVSTRWPTALELKVNCSPCLNERDELIGRALLFCDVTSEKKIQLEVSQAVADRLLALTEPNGKPQRPAGLTGQETEILRLLGQGLSNQAIAEHAGISLGTVRSHLKNIYRKLEIESRAAAVRFAVRIGLA